MKRTQWTAWVLLFLGALLVRAVYLIELRDTALLDVLIGDGKAYDAWARNLIEDGWLGSDVFYQAPFYPYFLGAVYALFGPHVLAARIVQILLGSISCVLLGLAGEKFFDRRIGMLAGWMLALYAPAVFFDALIQKGALGLLWTSLLAFLLATMLDGVRAWQPLAAGFVLGLFALTRENALLLVPLAGLWTFARAAGRSSGKRWTMIGLLLAGLAVALLPVGLRNRHVGGEFLLTTSQLGPNLFIGNNPDAIGTYAPLSHRRGDPRLERLDATRLAEEATGRTLTPGEVSDYWRDRALSYARERPVDWLALMARKWALTWNAREIDDFESIEAYRDHSRVLNALAGVGHLGVLVPLSVVGVWCTWKRRRRLWVLYAHALVVAAGVTVFYVFARYRLPMIPVLILLAAAGLVEGARRVYDDRRRALRVLMPLLAVSALAANWPFDLPWNPRASHSLNLGIELSSAGDHARAEAWFRRVLAVYPDEPRVGPVVEARRRLARSLEEQGKADEAIEAYGRYLELRSDPDAHVRLGALFADQSELARAIEQWKRAVELDPDHLGAHLNLGRALAMTARPAEAREHDRTALALARRLGRDDLVRDLEQRLGD